MKKISNIKKVFKELTRRNDEMIKLYDNLSTRQRVYQLLRWQVRYIDIAMK